jgi:hypothetical protein
VERPLGDLLEWLRLAGTALKRKMPAWHSVWDRWVMQVTSSNRFRYLEFLQHNLKGHHSLAALWGTDTMSQLTRPKNLQRILDTTRTADH